MHRASQSLVEQPAFLSFAPLRSAVRCGEAARAVPPRASKRARAARRRSATSALSSASRQQPRRRLEGRLRFQRLQTRRWSSSRRAGVSSRRRRWTRLLASGRTPRLRLRRLEQQRSAPALPHLPVRHPQRRSCTSSSPPSWVQGCPHATEARTARRPWFPRSRTTHEPMAQWISSHHMSSRYWHSSVRTQASC